MTKKGGTKYKTHTHHSVKVTGYCKGPIVLGCDLAWHQVNVVNDW